MSSKHREGGLVCVWFFTLLCALMFALVLAPGFAPSAERPAITLRAGPGEQYAVVATVPTASSMELTIFDKHNEWS